MPDMTFLVPTVQRESKSTMYNNNYDIILWILTQTSDNHQYP